MVKLSELSKDTELWIGERYGFVDPSIITVGEYLDDSIYKRNEFQGKPVFLAQKAYQGVTKEDFKSYLVQLGDDQCYEDWGEQVFDSLYADCPAVVDAFFNALEKATEAHPNYYAGDSVDLDTDAVLKPSSRKAELIHAAGACFCHECRNFRRNEENETYCNDVNGLSEPNPQDFCSYGKRKQEVNTVPVGSFVHKICIHCGTVQLDMDVNECPYCGGVHFQEWFVDGGKG